MWSLKLQRSRASHRETHQENPSYAQPRGLSKTKRASQTSGPPRNLTDRKRDLTSSPVGNPAPRTYRFSSGNLVLRQVPADQRCPWIPNAIPAVQKSCDFSLPHERYPSPQNQTFFLRCSDLLTNHRGPTTSELPIWTHHLSAKHQYCDRCFCLE